MSKVGTLCSYVVIRPIQEKAVNAVKEMGQVTVVIDKINESVIKIDRTMNEQAESAREIENNARQGTASISDVHSNVERTSQLSVNINAAIAQVRTSANDTVEDCTKVGQSAMSLSDMSQRLTHMVGQFKV